jgi:hypothetical protein
MDRREAIVKTVFEKYKEAHPKDNWLSFDEVKAVGTADIVYAAMDEYYKEGVLEAFEYVVKNTTGHHIDEKGNVEFKFKGEWITKQQLFENFL